MEQREDVINELRTFIKVQLASSHWMLRLCHLELLCLLLSDFSQVPSISDLVDELCSRYSSANPFSSLPFSRMTVLWS